MGRWLDEAVPVRPELTPRTGRTASRPVTRRLGPGDRAMLGTVTSMHAHVRHPWRWRVTSSALLAVVAACCAAPVARAVDPTPSPNAAGTAASPVTPLPTNRTPAIAPAISFPQGPGGVVTGTLTPVSPPSTPLTYTAPAQPARGTVTVDPASGAFTYTPSPAARHAAAAPGGPTIDAFTVSVSDGYGGTTTVPVTVPVAPANTAPVVTATQVTAPAKATGVVRGTVTAVDADGDPVNFAGSGRTARGSVTVSPSGTFAYTPTTSARRVAAAAPASSAARSDLLTINITDGYGGATALPVRVPIR